MALGAVLFAGLLGIELMHWQMTRHLAQVALTEAARAGATGHGQPSLMAEAFEIGMAPRYAAPDGNGRARLRGAWSRLQARAGLPVWRIWIAQPDQAIHADFDQRGLALSGAARGQPAIRNDYQAEQHERNLARWPQGRGPRSGSTIYEANMLHLQLIYLVDPLVPAIRPLLRGLAAGVGDACTRQALAAGLLPIRIEMTMDMQSHPVHWPAGHGFFHAGQAC